MKIFKFIVSNTFLKKSIIVVSTLGLFLLSNYIIFISARSAISTLQGYSEIKELNQEGNYTANLDPSSDMNMDFVNKNSIQQVYNYLTDNIKYAFFTDGFVVQIPNTYDMEVTVAYVNEEYYELNRQFDASRGCGLGFDYALSGDNTEIPVLIGKGLSEAYPVGSLITIEDPALQMSLRHLWMAKTRREFYRCYTR